MVDLLHGVRVPDPHRWLEEGASEEVRAWTQAQSAFARAELAKLPERDALLKRFRELYDVERVSAPLLRGGRYFWSKKEAGQEKEAVHWRQGKTGEPKVLLDPNGWSPDGSVSLGSWLPSWDGRYITYQIRKNNSDEATLEIVEVATGKKLPEVIEGAKYADRTATAWDEKSAGLYYVKVPPLGGPVSVADRPGLAEIRYHALGDDPARDRLVREATRDPKTFHQVAASRDGRWLIATVQHGWVSTDVYIQDLRAGKKAPWTPLVTGQPHLYWVDPHRDHLYILTDEGAPNYRILRADPRKPARERWVEVVPERRDEKLDHLSIVGNRLGLVYLKDVSARLEVRELDGRPAYEVKLPGIGSVPTLRGDPEDDEAYFAFESFTVPLEIHALSVRTGRTDVTYRTRVPVDTAATTTEQVFVTSKDGTRVPVFVLQRKGAQRVRRRHRGGGAPRASGLHAARSARARGPLERRAARGGGDHAAPRPVQGGALPGAFDGHGPIPPVRIGQDVDRGVRLGRRPRGFPRALRLLTVPPRARGDRLPGPARDVRRQRRSRRPHARTQVRGRAPGRLDGRARAAARPGEGRARRRRQDPGAGRGARGRIRVRAVADRPVTRRGGRLWAAASPRSRRGSPRELKKARR
ncbi:uncharacterized protein SOCE26_080860 [Sorangium cellulosum]|uniref:Peptidase S9A N-terminal domain-containing protein n=1 Tax=Sorangium cellulosum TaxID=56 RepID=A0A2L0F4T1_SORCE|nr:uncharacterized protein SOCE26_080860 [Sorangium cellulosum]